MAEGLIFNIQKFCINDGPGIRTTVFFKGCPLRCKWCHNPESNEVSPQLLYSSDKCIGCGKCAAVCEKGVHTFSDSHILVREKCIKCGKCENVCNVGALEIAGKLISAGEVIREVLKDKAFYEDSGGGITLSGGEPFLQFSFLIDILRIAKENGLHTCIETCGFTDSEKILEAAKYTDIFLYDYKLTDSLLHKEYTGAGNEKILSNLRLLDVYGSKIILRCPIIPGVNDNESHFKGIAKTADSLKNVQGIELSPYHELGTSKLRRMGKDNAVNFRTPKKEDIEKYIESVSAYTSVPVKRM